MTAYKYSELDRKKSKKRCRDVFIAAIILNSYDTLMANILTDLSNNIHYLFIIKNSIWQTACNYSDVLGESGAFE